MENEAPFHVYVFCAEARPSAAAAIARRMVSERRGDLVTRVFGGETTEILHVLE